MTTSTPSHEQDKLYPRTHYEAVLDIRYACVFSRLNVVLYDRIDVFFGFVGLAGGSAAVASVLTQQPGAAVTAGLTLAVMSILERLVNAARKSEQHKQAVAQFAELDARAPSMTLAEVDAELARLRAAAPQGFAGLAEVAFNANLRSNGRASHCISLPAWSRVLRLMA